MPLSSLSKLPARSVASGYINSLNLLAVDCSQSTIGHQQSPWSTLVKWDYAGRMLMQSSLDRSAVTLQTFSVYLLCVRQSAEHGNQQWTQTTQEVKQWILWCSTKNFQMVLRHPLVQLSSEWPWISRRVQKRQTALYEGLPMRELGTIQVAQDPDWESKEQAVD